MTGVYALFREGAIPFLPRQGEGRAEGVTEGEDGDARYGERTAVLPLHHSANAERSPSPWRGRTCWDQPLAADVRMLPLMPLGKKPPAVTAALLRKTMLSTWPVERL